MSNDITWYILEDLNRQDMPRAQQLLLPNTTYDGSDNVNAKALESICNLFCRNGY